MWNTLKKAFGYRKEEEVATQVIRPVRVDGKPAKHLEQPEEERFLKVTEGYFRKTSSLTKLGD